MTNAANPPQVADTHPNQKPVAIKVNGQVVSVPRHSTVGDVLDAAGYASADHYLVEVKNGKEGKEYRDASEIMHLHDSQEFRAYFVAPTPVS